jgi:hypothetical protein
MALLDFFKRNQNGNAVRADVTVILNVWKRQYLKEQLDTLSKQTGRYVQVFVIQCGNHVNIDKDVKGFPDLHRIHSTADLKYFFRFSLASYITTKYTWIIDDDVIPSPQWTEACIEMCESTNSIVSSSGRIIPVNDYLPESPKYDGYIPKYFVGDGDNNLSYNYCEADTVVDFGCNSWFLKTDWIRHFWAINPYTLSTGEDIHLGATSKIGGGISTIVPKQTSPGLCGNLRKRYGFDQFASWKRESFLSEREKVLRYLVEDKGWLPKLWSLS